MLSLLRLVVPLDGTPLPNASLPLATSLARGLRLPVVLLRAVPPLDGSRQAQQTLKEAEKRLAAVAHEVSAHGVDTAWQVLEGSHVECIPSALRAGDLVVLGFARRRELGALPRRLLESAAQPVVLRRAGGRRVIRVERIGSPATGQARAFADDLAAALDATIRPTASGLVGAPDRTEDLDLLVIERAHGPALDQADLDIPVLVV